MKSFIANIFLKIGTVVVNVGNKSIDYGLNLHIKWNTKYGRGINNLQQEIITSLKKELEKTKPKRLPETKPYSVYTIKPKL